MTPEDSFNDTYSDYSNNYDDEFLPEQRDNRWELDEQEAVADFRNAFKDQLTAEGSKEISLWIKIALNKHKALSNLTQEEINDICWDYGRTLNLALVTKSRRWGLETNADRLQIKNFLIELIQTHLKRAYKDGERKYRGIAYRGVGNEEKGSSKNGFKLSDMFPEKKKPRRETQLPPEIEEETELI